MLVLAVLAMLQTAVFVLTGAGPARIAGIALGAVTLAVAGLPKIGHRDREAGLLALTFAGWANFVWHLLASPPEFPYRLVQLAAGLGYGAVFLALPVMAIGRMQKDRALLLTISCLAGLWGFEAVLEVAGASLWAGGRVRWIGGTAPHPVLGEYYPPHSRAILMYPDNPRGYFEEPGGNPSAFPGVQHFVRYRFNSLGCRGADYPVPRPPHHRRIVVLGDSFTLGVGVHEQDTVAARLEQALNARADGRVYEVINCGVSGYATRQERLFYELFAARYRPDAVLLLMVVNDDRSWSEDVKLGYSHVPRKAEHLLYTWRLIQLIRHRRPDPDFTSAIPELVELQKQCRKTNARLGVGFFHHGEFFVDHWRDLVRTVSTGVEEHGIPWIDLGPEIMNRSELKDVVVHEFDRHPNEIAHRIAAEALERFVRRQGWLQ